MGHSIYLADDEKSIRELLHSFLASDGYTVRSFENGDALLEAFRQEPAELVILDIMMPGTDGLTVCRELRAVSDIPIILLTAKDSIQDKEEGYESGADSYLTKPFSAKLLNSRVHNLLESRKKLALIVANRTKELKPEQQEETIKLNKLDEEFLTKFTTIVEENIDMEKMDMSFMMEKMNMSHSTLYRKIKSLTGMSGNELIRKIRLKNSLRLLMEEGHNISEAAYASGFNDLGYFRSCFREEYGMAPSEYIKQKK